MWQSVLFSNVNFCGKPTTSEGGGAHGTLLCGGGYHRKGFIFFIFLPRQTHDTNETKKETNPTPVCPCLPPASGLLSQSPSEERKDEERQQKIENYIVRDRYTNKQEAAAIAAFITIIP